MSKGKGQKIAVKFDKPLLGDVTGLENPINFKVGTNDLAQGRPVTVGNQTYGSGSNAVDGNDGTYWGTYSTMPWWISVDLGETKKTAGFYILQSNSSYRGRAYAVLGSHDGAAWDTIAAGEMANVAAQTIEYPASDYRYIRLNVTSYWSSSRMYVYTLKILEAAPAGNEMAFTITGMQRNPLRVGELQLKEFKVTNVERYMVGEEESPDTLLLTFDTYNRFNDVDGDITIAYNQALGSIVGTRPVETFSVAFTPTDLEPTPIDEHTLTAGIEITADFIQVFHIPIFHAHTTTAGIDLAVQLIHVNDINP